MNNRTKAGLKYVFVAFALILMIQYPIGFAHALQISNVQATNIGTDHATITWTTDQPADGRVVYGNTTNVTFTKSHPQDTTDHSITISTGIKSNSRYFYKVSSATATEFTELDNNGQLYSFFTKDAIPPEKVENVQSPSVTQSTIQLFWDKVGDDDVEGYLVFINRIPELNLTKAETSAVLINLTPDTEYSITIAAYDAAQNKGQSSDALLLQTKPLDVTPPEITNLNLLQSKKNGQDTLTISWQTDENATAKMLYETGNNERVEQDELPQVNHSFILTSLAQGQTYLYSVQACDVFGNCAEINNSFVAGSDNLKPKIEVDIPRFSKNRVIDIAGSTESFSEVRLFVNNLDIPIRTLAKEETGPEGTIQFRGIFLNDKNTIKITTKDVSGNTNSQRYKVDVDTTKPVVSLTSFPEIAVDRNYTVRGETSEPVTVKVFVRDLSKNATKPEKVVGFTNGSIGQNFIELKWERTLDNDFSHYIIAREDVGPIAIANPDSYVTYTDILVDSGKTYAYTISSVNSFGKQSEPTEPLLIRTLPGGVVAGLQPPVIDTQVDFSEPKHIDNVSKKFSFALSLATLEGDYNVKIEFSDRAGNKVIKEKKVRLDTTPPEIRIHKPSSGSIIFENYADNVDIEGSTEPGSRLFLFIDRTPANNRNTTFDVAKLQDNIYDYDTARLEESCNTVTRTFTSCASASDYATTADSDGVFHFEDVDIDRLSRPLGAQQLSIDEYSDLHRFGDLDKDVQLVFIAEDPSGLRNVHHMVIHVGNCFSGNFSWDVVPLLQYQMPTLISSERLAENTERISFLFNYSYVGRGANPEIKNVQLLKACGTEGVLDQRFETGCRLMPGGAQAALPNPEKSITYSEVPLLRLENMDRFLQDDWEDFFNATSNEVSFPFKVQIDYEHEVNNQIVRETQTVCQEVSYVFDNSRVDPRDVLPDWLLYDFVDFLDDASEFLGEVQETLNEITPLIGAGCLASFGGLIGTQLVRRFKAIIAEKKVQFSLLSEQFSGGFLKSDFGVQSAEDQEYCKNLIGSFQNSNEYAGVFELEWVSDKDLERCFPTLVPFWNTEARIYQAQRWTCDRLFGHKAPARWTQTKTDEEIDDAIAVGNVCTSDQSVKGQHLRVVNCKELEGKYRSTFAFERADRCVEITTTVHNSRRVHQSLYKIEGPVQAGSSMHELTIADVAGARVEFGYAIKQDEDNFITARSQTCEQVCGIQRGTTRSLDRSRLQEGLISVEETPGGGQKAAYCIPAQQCIELNQKVKGDKEVLKAMGSDSEQFEVTYAKREGFTSDCFYDGGQIALYEDSNWQERPECCCLGAQETEANAFYHISDTYLDPAISTEPVHERDEAAPSTGDYQPIKWSYRYWKNKFPAEDSQGNYHNSYNEYRYITGRDLPACFGQNDILDSVTGGETTVMLDPARNHLATFQCANIGGIQNRVVFMNNLINSMRQCLVHVRTTGTGDSAVCKELFTQYVCSAMWRVLQYTQNQLNGCGQDYFDLSSDPNYELGTAEYVAGGFQAITETLGDSQATFLDEYGNAKLNEMFGGGQEAIARKVCLAAFGYDWEFTVDNLLAAAYAQPFATFVFVVPEVGAKREFLHFNPVTNTASYEYRGAWTINPGCPLANYRVDLACITRDELESGKGADCTRQGSPDGINCPCLDIAETVQPYNLFTGNERLDQNQLEDNGAHLVLDNSPYRYDHLKFTLRTDSNIDSKIKESCFPKGHEDGVYYFPIKDITARDIIGCQIQPASGQLGCADSSEFFTSTGFAQFGSVLINGRDAQDVTQLFTGDRFEIEADILNRGSDKCLEVELAGPVERTHIFPVTADGQNVFVHQFIEELGISGEGPGQEIEFPSGFSGRLESIDGNRNVQIRIQAIDKSLGPDGKASNEPDRLYDPAHDEVTIDGQRVIFDDTERALSSTLTVTGKPGGSMVVKKNGAEIFITNIEYFIGGTPQKTIGGLITAFSPEDSSATLQTLTVDMSLYNLHDGVETFQSQSDCNFNEVIRNSQGTEQKRHYVVRVKRASDHDAEIAPVASSIATEPTGFYPAPEIRFNVSTSVKVGTSSELLKVEIEIEDGSEAIVATQEMVLDRSIRDKYWAEFTGDEFLSPGTHKIFIKTTYIDRTDNDIEKTKRAGPKGFQIYCSPPKEGKRSGGVCRPSCGPTDTAVTDLSCPTENAACCEV